MEIPEEKRQIIADLLKRFLASDQSSPLAQIAAAHQAVPLYGSWTGTIFLRVDGQFFTVDQEDHPGEFLAELSEPWQIASLATAARADSSFRVLLPERAPVAATCTFCKGEGYILFGDKKLDVTCGECAGLGWLDPRLKQKAE